jgi:hypothetical protein
VDASWAQYVWETREFIVENATMRGSIAGSSSGGSSALTLVSTDRQHRYRLQQSDLVAWMEFASLAYFRPQKSDAVAAAHAQIPPHLKPLPNRERGGRVLRPDLTLLPVWQSQPSRVAALSLDEPLDLVRRSSAERPSSLARISESRQQPAAVPAVATHASASMPIATRSLRQPHASSRRGKGSAVVAAVSVESLQQPPKALPSSRASVI